MAKTPRPRWNEIIPTIDKGSNEQTVGEANIVAPFTTIQNRAKVEANCKVVGASERIRCNSLKLVPNEFGPNGEPVYTSDKEDSRIRFVGDWGAFYDSNGTYCSAGVTGANKYVEITFYGTGLNYVGYVGNDNDIRVSIDGGPDGLDIHPTASGVLNNRNTSQNTILHVANNLTLDWHTIKITRVGGSNSTVIFGFEILNESSDLTVLSGSIFKRGYEYKLESNTTLPMIPTAYSGTNGGRVLTYIDENFEVQQAVNEVGTPAYLASADHSNEAIYRKVNFREFGRNRSENDDFSTLSTTNSDRAFTLDDGTTTLVGNDVAATSESLGWLAAGYLTLTFVGSGLDMLVTDSVDDGLTIGNVEIDGVNIGTWTRTAGRQKICSDLPYGTHTVKLTSIVGGFGGGPTDFIIYRPKKPTVAKELPILADYNIMADFVANTTPDDLTNSQGILRKQFAREFIYGGSGWSIALPSVTVWSGGGFTTTSTSGDYIEYTFLGTGFDFRFDSNTAHSNNVLVELNGITFNSTNYPSATFNTYGDGIAFDSGTGVLDQRSTSFVVGAGFVAKDLPLGSYTIRFTTNTSFDFRVSAIDIITPIHSPNLMIGSLGISDEREKIIVKERELDLVFSNSAPEIMNSTGIAQIIVNADDDFRVYLEDAFIDKFYKASFMGQHTGGTTTNKIISRIFNNATDTQSCMNIIIEGNADSAGTSTVNCDWISVQIKGKQQKDVFKD